MKPDRRRLVIYAGAMMGPLGGNAVLALIPLLKVELDTSVSMVAASITVMMIPFIVLQLFSGPLADRYGRCKIIIFGLGLYTTGTALCGLATTINLFLAARFIQGVGFAFTSPIVLALLGDITEPETRGRAMGWFGACTTAGIALGPLLAGLIAEVNWRFAFALIAGLGVLLMIAVYVSFRDYHQPRDAVEMSLAETVGATLNRNVALISLTGMLVFFSNIGAITYLSDNLSLFPHNYPPSVIGTILAFNGIAGMMFSPIAGVLVDRIGRRNTATIGVILLAVALTILPHQQGFAGLAGTLFIMGCGTSTTWAALNTLTIESAPPQHRGVASSIYNSSRFTGYALAPVLMAPLYVGHGLVVVCAMGAAASLAALMLVRNLRPIIILDNGVGA